MRRARPLSLLILCSAVVGLVAGCSWFDDWNDEDNEEVEAAATDDPGLTADERPPTILSAAAPSAQPLPGPPATTEMSPQTTLVRTVVQQLRQRTPNGWVDGRSLLELTMTLAAEPSLPKPASAAADSPDNTHSRYRVRYQRVRVQEELPDGTALEYDSDNPPTVVPTAIQPYQGLKDNGFQFALNREGQLTEVIGFDAFLERCLQFVESERRPHVCAALPVKSPEEGVAFFVDDSIGLIPPGMSKAGDSWLRSRHIVSPVVLTSAIRYTLRQVTSEFADVDLTGTLEAATGAEPEPGRAAAAHLRVQGGRIRGESRIDRRTGLPTQTRTEQVLDMIVQLPDGTEIEQFKTTTTTLETLPGRRAPPPITLLSGQEKGLAPPQSGQRTASQDQSAPR